MTCGVAGIKNKRNGRIYIYNSKNIEKLTESYEKKLESNKFKHNKELQRDWNSYGRYAFNFTILEKCENNSKTLNKIKNKHIKKYKNPYNQLKAAHSSTTRTKENTMDNLNSIVGTTALKSSFIKRLYDNDLDERDGEKIVKECKKLLKNSKNNSKKEINKLIDELIYRRKKQNSLYSKADQLIDYYCTCESIKFKKAVYKECVNKIDSGKITKRNIKKIIPELIEQQKERNEKNITTNKRHKRQQLYSKSKNYLSHRAKVKRIKKPQLNKIEEQLWNGIYNEYITQSNYRSKIDKLIEKSKRR